MGVLSDKVAVVTGGGAGIGRAVCLALGRSGAKVAVLDADGHAADETCALLMSEGASALAVAASVAEADAVERAFAAIDQQLGPVDILVNNAGVTGNCPALELSHESWRRVMSINLDGAFYCTQTAGRRMAQTGGGAIVNLSSIYGLVGAPNRLAYSATKGAIVMMTKSLAVEWAALGIRVNCVAPGYVDTPGTQELALAGRIDLPALERRTPQHRLAQPEEIAEAILFLCEPRAAHITGQVLAVDGGWSAYGYI